MRSGGRGRRVAAIVTIHAALAGCDEPPDPARLEPVASAPPSPNASILPAALGSAAPGPRVTVDAGRALPEASARLQADAAVPPTPLTEADVARDRSAPRESAWLTLAIALSWGPDPAPPHESDVSRDAFRRAVEATRHKVSVDLLPSGRMRWVFVSGTLPLPPGTELRSRVEHFGHVLVWPDGSAQRVVPPGALRALLVERRADVMPLAEAKLGPREERASGAQSSIRQVVSTEVGRLELDQSRLAGAGVAGALLCRVLLELIGADPSSPACQDDLTPSRARVSSPGGGALELAVGAVERRTDQAGGSPFARPPGVALRHGGLPPAVATLLERPALAALRTRAVEGDRAPGAPAEGLVVVNRTDLLQYVLLDGLPIAWVAPRAEHHVFGPQAGAYTVGSRDLLGIEPTPPLPVRLPARVVLGEVGDAGVP